MQSFLEFEGARLVATERAGFEPAVLNKEHTGFRNRLDQPLRHLSVITHRSTKGSR
jgi:hypothetical protein